MTRRKLGIALVATGVLSVGLGASLNPAQAESKTCLITLATGGQVTLTLPECTTAGIPGAQSVADITPAEPQPAPAPTTPQGEGTQTGTGTTPTQPPDPDKPPAPQPTTSSGVPKPVDVPEETTALGPRRLEDVVPGQLPGKPAPRTPEGAPTVDNPSFSTADFGPARVGVPNFFIDKFRIPPFLLPIYQAAGIEYNVPWQVLAAINEIETDYGRNLNVSSAGALGWMQFIPSSWRAYGTDANADGKRDPYNPVDAIFAAGRYLKAAGAEKDLRRAIFAYNHADWYVDSVMMRSKLIGGIPADLVGSLTGLTEGHFPIAAKATYADDLSERDAAKRVTSGNAANPVEATAGRRAINIYAKPGSPAIAVNDGVIEQIGQTKKLGKFVVLQDVYGNRYTYSHLGKVAPSYPEPKPRDVSAAQIRAELELPNDPKPRTAASAGRQAAAAPAAAAGPPSPTAGRPTGDSKERLFAHPRRPAAYRAGGQEQMLETGGPVAGFTTFEAYFSKVLGLKRDDVVLKPLVKGATVVGGTILGRVEKTMPNEAPHLMFEIKPAGRGAPNIDPKPILDGWKLLESTAIYRAAGRNPFFGPDAKNPSIGQILLMSKEALERRVLADPRIEIYGCGRRDVQTGQIDRRVLATLSFLAASGLKPTVTSLKCGHSFYTSAGGVSHHSSGNAVDIAAVNGIPIIGHQGPGSITEMAVRRLLTLQGTIRPTQIISLMKFAGADNTISMGDHHDHIHVGFQPLYGTNSKLARQFNAVLKPGQWIKLIDRISDIENPVVSPRPSRYALPAARQSDAHGSE